MTPPNAAAAAPMPAEGAAPVQENASPAGKEGTGQAPAAAAGQKEHGKPGDAAPNAPDVKSAGVQQQLKELGEQDMTAIVTVKIDGKTRKMTVGQALKHVELAQGAHKRMEEASQIRKQALQEVNNTRALLSLLHTDPDRFAKITGWNPDEFAEKRLLKHMENRALTDEQKEALRLKEENAALKKEREDRERRENETKQQQEEREAKETSDKDIAEAWKESGLPQDLFYAKQIAAVMRDSIVLAAQGKMQRPLTAKESADIIKDRFESSLLTISDKCSPEQLLRMIGEKNFSRMREWDLKRVTEPAPPTLNSPTRPGNSSGKPTENQNRKGPLSEEQAAAVWASL